MYWYSLIIIYLNYFYLIFLHSIHIEYITLSIEHYSSTAVCMDFPFHTECIRPKEQLEQSKPKASNAISFV